MSEDILKGLEKDQMLAREVRSLADQLNDAMYRARARNIYTEVTVGKGIGTLDYPAIYVKVRKELS
jgi:hypothetical protein